MEASSSIQVKGVDISSIIAFENSGTTFKYENGAVGDVFDILKDAGVNYARIRVWNNPYNSYGVGYGLGGFYREPTWIGTTASDCANDGTGFASAESGNYELMYKSTVSEYSTSNCGSSWDNMALFDSD